ncbi:intraflagellar transport protein 122 homolog [Cloeon dipterum]|uniref:intraflagellar transport protein 122 homolog n=1 Tax=Cloeon dipterum TaxID=197152 RepID=UPI00321FE582
MRTVPTWVDKVQDHDKVEQCVYDLCFSPDGAQLIVAAGQRVLVYDANDGSLIQPLKGHKDNVYCVNYAKDGKRFASGSSDKSVIIWTNKLEGILKYTHSDAIQCLAYNPISHQLASCAISDFGLWAPQQKAVQKHKSNARINACAWSNDGQILALGLASGCISLRSKTGEEKSRLERPGLFQSPIWGLAFNPAKDDGCDTLCVADWSQTLSFYAPVNKKEDIFSYKIAGKERSLGFDPLSISYFNQGQYLLVSGSGGNCILLTRDGVRLGVIGQQETWVWGVAARPDSNFIALGCNDGTIAYYQLVFSTVHGLYKERYAYRENMTDVIIQHLLTEQKVRIKCRELIKKIAIYKHRLAVQLPERIIIYELYAGDSSGMHYRVKEKINQKLVCNLLVVCADHLVLCQERRLQCLNLQGAVVREWVMDSLIRYIKVVGGPPGREGLLVGLKNGEVFKIFIDNPFPISLLKIGSPIRCLDLSASRKKLSIVDENSQCLVYDLQTSELLYQQPNANSVAWNSHFEDMLCFSGNNLLSIKVADFPVHQQKLSGFVVGLCGSKIFCLHIATMSTVEVPLSAPMYQYLEKKMFREAYQVACLGVTEGDWESLAHAALDDLDLSVSRLAFIRIKDINYLQLIYEIEERQRKGENRHDVFLADVLAFRGQFKEAARLYKKEGQPQKALEMYTDLRMFHLAQEYLGSEESATLTKKKADWAKSINEPRAAAEMYLSAGETMKAIDIIAENGWIDMLLEIGRKLDKSDVEVMARLAEHLSALGHLPAAADMYRKLGNIASVVKLYVQAREWREAFSLAEQHPNLRDLVYVPYAQWLAENDNFLLAQKAFHKAGRPQEALKVLQQLTDNAINEKRFDDAGYYNWVLSMQYLDMAREKLEEQDNMLKRFMECQQDASIYYAYHAIQRYTDEPFTSYMPEALFNIARFLLHEIKDSRPKGVLQFSILYTLAKQGSNLGANKLAQQVITKMQKMRIPPRFQENVESTALAIRALPFTDNEDLQPMCYRCSSYNPLLTNYSNNCANCFQPWVFSYVSFETLPLVEFRLEAGITDEEAARLLQLSDESKQPSGWKEGQEGEAEVLTFDESATHDPFTTPALNFDDYNDLSTNFITLGRDNLKALEPHEVIIMKWPPPLRCQYYRNLLPDVPIAHCQACNKVFHVDDFELQTLQKGHCPFCRTPPPHLKQEKEDDLDMFLN